MSDFSARVRFNVDGLEGADEELVPTKRRTVRRLPGRAGRLNAFGKWTNDVQTSNIVTNRDDDQWRQEASEGPRVRYATQSSKLCEKWEAKAQSPTFGSE